MREVFVLGAGASAASSGTPLGESLVWNYHQDCSFMKDIVNGEPDLREDNIQFQNYERFLQIVASYFPELKTELEKFRTRREALYQPPRFKNKKYYIDEILMIVQKNNDNVARKIIKTLILEHLTDPFRTNNLYEVFIAKVLKNKKAETVSLVSFNFDVLLHENFKTGIFFDYLIEFDSITPSRKLSMPTCIPLIKLNGSLDWGICLRCKRLSLNLYSVQRGFYEQEKCRCEGDVEPFIVMPHEEYAEKINVLWNKAAEQLKLAQKVTIIGYSFPEYDQRAISLFKSNLNENVELKIVDYQESTIEKRFTLKRLKEKYAEMFPFLKGEIEISLEGFGKFVDDYKGI